MQPVADQGIDDPKAVVFLRLVMMGGGLEAHMGGEDDATAANGGTWGPGATICHGGRTLRSNALSRGSGWRGSRYIPPL
jgi:hypothetical protein